MKVLKFAFVLMLGIMVASCSQVKKATVESAANETNTLCPIDLDPVGVVQKVTYDDNKNALLYHIDVAEDFDLNKVKPAELKELFGYWIANEKEALEEISENDGAIIFEFKSKDGKERRVEFNTDDLKKLLKQENSENQENEFMVKAMIMGMNMVLPMDMGDGLEFTNTTENGKYVIFNFSMKNASDLKEVIEKSKDAAVLEEVKNAFKTSLLADPSFKAEIEPFIQSGRGIIFKFQSNGVPETLDLTYEPGEL